MTYDVRQAPGSTETMVFGQLRLILRGLLYPIDDKDLHGCLDGFQFQPKLFLNGREDRWAGRVRRADRVSAYIQRVLADAGSPLALNIEAAGEVGLVDHESIQPLSEESGEKGKRDGVANHAAGRELECSVVGPGAGK